MQYNRRLKTYCNQTAQLERYADTDNYGNPTYSEAETIKARIEGHYKLFRDENGETKTSTTRIFSPVEVGINDKINGRFVIDAMMMTDKCGNVIGWEIYA